MMTRLKPIWDFAKWIFPYGFAAVLLAGLAAAAVISRIEAVRR